jgi:hypothetical protein
MNIERRRNDRYPLVYPVKVRCMESGRYYSGKSVNLSTSGALLEMPQSPRLRSGQRVQVGIAWSPREVILRSAFLIPATVVRDWHNDGTITVAIQFDQPQQLANAA